eukprot:GHVR01012696.1.p1 GENE.GHVR01012696.1~~GHVR01012696.1.p1  ORF type:complete len:120 (-),score=15.11 GHVR01012696.1:514-873(-)
MINLLLIYLRISYLFYIAKAQFSSVINVDCDFQFEYYTKEEVTSVLETCYLDNLVKTDGYTTSNKYALAEIKNFEAAYTTVHLFKKYVTCSICHAIYVMLYMSRYMSRYNIYVIPSSCV